MQKLTNQYLPDAFAYLSPEPEFNLFFLGDLERFGMEHENVSCFTDDDWKPGEQFPYFILNFRGDVLIYSQGAYDGKKVAEYLNELRPDNISGKDEVLRPLVPYLHRKVVKPTHMSRINEVSSSQKAAYGEKMKLVRRLTEADVPDIYELYLTIDEFAYSYRSKSREECYDDLRQNISGLGRTYGIYEEGTLAAVAQTSAENRQSAMVIGVATRPDKRGKGYAKATVLKMCSDCMEDGMDFLCLFYDNPSAGRIYHSIGFKDLGIYTMIRKS